MLKRIGLFLVTNFAIMITLTVIWEVVSRLGFIQMGEVTAHRPDGSTRPSLYWELERSGWEDAKATRRAG